VNVDNRVRRVWGRRINSPLLSQQPQQQIDLGHIIDLTGHTLGNRLMHRERAMRLGKDQRRVIPRGSLGQLADRPADFDLLKVIAQADEGRLSHLIAVRARRMSVSPFAFFRGMPLLMTQDLAREPHSGLLMQICGDCHLLNFGGFASPERNLLFGINDFDETALGPFEWDIKRLITSVVIAAVDVGLGEQAGLEAVRELLSHYRSHLRHMMTLSPLQVWYESIDADDLLASTENNRIRKKRAKHLSGAYRRTTQSVLPKLTLQDELTGLRQFVDEPPLIWHPAQDEPFGRNVRGFFRRYRETLKSDRRILFDRYQLTDVALKVVGVGSVGTRCAVALFEDGDHQPLILQMKEARASVLAHVLPLRYRHEGQRVIQGQQLMQAASDIFLGFATSGVDKKYYYVRQLRDMKISANLDDMDAIYLLEYARSCGMALAHAHGKAGHPDVLTGYLGSNERFSALMVEYARQSAARNAQDYAVFMRAVDAGIIPLASEAVV
jgi:uncharacterized protein (DUF2252 family)